MKLPTMKARTLPVLAMMVLLLGLPAVGRAQYKPEPLQPLTMSSEPGPRSFQTTKSGEFNGRKIRYEVEIAETIIKDKDGKPSASLFSYAYIAKGVAAPAKRPVLFAFNGGPGASSAFFHFGSIGPRIMAPEASGELVANPLSPLDVADLVFLDPVDTGYSRTTPGLDGDQFYSIDGDSEAMSQQIINWLRAHNRLNSPVYLYGESYGTMRAVAMARDLFRSSPQIKVAGVILGANSLGYMQKGQMPDILFEANALPMMASVAWHHGKIDNKGQSWAEAVEKARLFARTTYINALMQGYELSDRTREAVLRQLPSIIGIPESYFRERQTIVVDDFKSQLLSDEGLVLDGYDGRVTYPADSERQQDYSHFRIAMERWAEAELQARKLGPYIEVNRYLNPRWDYYTAGAMALDVTLAQAMKDNGTLRVMMTQGRYDTATTVGNSEYILRQAALDRSRYTIALYDGGHILEPTPEIMNAIRHFLQPENRPK